MDLITNLALKFSMIIGNKKASALPRALYVTDKHDHESLINFPNTVSHCFDRSLLSWVVICGMWCSPTVPL